LGQSIEMLAQMRYSRLVGWFKGWLADALLLAGDHVRARGEAQLGRQISADVGFTWAVGLAQRALGAIERADGHQREAERWLNEALHTFETVESRFDAARTYLALAALADEQHQPASAAAHRQAAGQLFSQLGLATGTGRGQQLSTRS
ncbi:MAG: hypothetical protein ACRDP9_25230, partial [Kribbellaceae bacterium]